MDDMADLKLALEDELDEEYAANEPKTTWQPNNIIVIAGSPSSGKTKMAEGLEPYLKCKSISMDHLPQKKLTQSLNTYKPTKQSIKTYTPQLSTKKSHGWNSCHLATVDALNEFSGEVVICDAVLANDGRQDLTKSFKAKLEEQGHRVYTLLMYSPLDKLLENIKKRNQSHNEQEHRNIWTVLLDYFETYCTASPRLEKGSIATALPLFASEKSKLSDIETFLRQQPSKSKRASKDKKAVLQWIDRLRWFEQTEKKQFAPRTYNNYEFIFINSDNADKTSAQMKKLGEDIGTWLKSQSTD